MGGVGARTTHPAGVYVEGSHQGMDARVIDNLEATEDLNLLPAVQTLPQCCCHLAQSLPEKKENGRHGLGLSPKEKGVIFSEEQVAGAGSEEGGGRAVCVRKKHT